MLTRKTVIVFPTCVGMNRAFPAALTRSVCVPHMRGDEPHAGLIRDVFEACSPHAWG